MRRKRSNGIWFPVIGGTQSDDPGTFRRTGFQIQQTLAAVAGDAGVHDVTNLVFDRSLSPSDGTATGTSPLALFLGSNYFLKRIVGKINCQMYQGASDSPACKIGAGLFIAREDQAFSGGGTPYPVGGTTNAERSSLYSPLVADCAEEPWIWRRTWILGNTAGASDVALYGRFLPVNHSDALSGPHVDAKTKRVVAQEERLWLALAVDHWPRSDLRSTTADITVTWDIDLRVFGNVFKARNRGTF